MDPNRWQHVSDLFEQALKRPRGQQATWVKRTCGDDEEVRSAVEALLAAHRDGGTADGPTEASVAIEDPARPGQQVGPYRIVSEIGRGGMGLVYKAFDPRLGRHVALKFLPPQLVSRDDARRRLLEEAQAVSGLDHPNICTVYDLGHTEEGRLYFAMAYYEGRSLDRRIAEGRLDLRELLPIAIQVAGGLAYAHRMGVIHRDVKPSNVQLTEVPAASEPAALEASRARAQSRIEAKILDFGLAKRGISSLTEPGTLLGTLSYMSPEQALGKELDPRTDVWSLGVMLFEMATGELPFSTDSEASLLHSIVNEDPQLHRDASPPLPTTLEPVVRRALQRRREDRYRSMEELLADLVAVERSLEEGSSPAVERVTPAESGVAPPATFTDSGSLLSRVTPTTAVGREREMALLRESWEACVEGRGGVLCINGEPGIGKTTLVQRFLADLAMERPQACVARGRCSERLAGTEAYLPILEALEDLSRGETGELATPLLKEVAPTWYVRIAPVAAAGDPSFARILADARVGSQERMKRELTAFLQELSRRRPLVLFCDDLHWADISTVDLLSYVGSRSDTMRLLVLGSYRPSDLLLAEHPFLEVQRELQSRGLCREVAVDLLREEDVAAFIEQSFPGHDLPDDLPSIVHARSEGNPLFMIELLRDLRDRSVLTQRDGVWVLAEPVAAIERDLPESVRAMIERKIERLDREDHRLLTGAAIQGQEFDSATVARVLGMAVEEVEERLENLGRRHRIVRSLEEAELPDGSLTQRYGFEHALYQNALYETLRPRQRASLSAATAEALIEAYGERDAEVASHLAYLFEAARHPSRASDYFLLAADQAAAEDANREALLLAGKAISNAERLEGEERLRRQLRAANRCGQLHLALSQLEEAIVAFGRAEVAAGELGDVEAQVNAICAAAQAHYNLRRTDVTLSEAQRALEIAREASCEPGIAAAELVVGLHHMCFGDTEQAKSCFAHSVPVVREHDPSMNALEAIGFAGLLHAWQLDYGAAHRAIRWTLSRARDLGSPYHTVLNLFVRGMARFNQGRLSEGLTDITEGMRMAEQNDETYWLSRFPNTMGWIYWELQDVDRALELNLEGADVARQTGYDKPEANAQVNLAQYYIDLGEPRRALEHLQQAEAIFEKDLWFRWRYDIRIKAQWARYWMRRGDSEKARAYAAESLAVAEPRKARKHMAWAHKLLGDVAVMEERFEDGRREYDASLEVLRHHHCPIIEWKILLGAADMASAFRQVPLAEHYRGRCQKLLNGLADSITDERRRRKFLDSEAVRAALL